MSSNGCAARFAELFSPLRILRPPPKAMRALTFLKMSGSVSDMKTVNAREFQKGFSKVAQELGQGETVAVTRHGKPLGFFTKAPARAAAAMPDFAGNLASVPAVGSAGEQMMAEILDEPLS